MSWLHAFVLIIGMVWAGAQNAHASIVQKGGGGMSIGRTGPNTARGTIKPSGSDFDDLIRRPANLKDGQSDFERLLDLPFKLPDIPADKATVKGLLSPANIGKALRGGIGGYVAGEAFKRLAEAACVRLAGGSMQPIPSGAWEECVPGEPPKVSDGYRYGVTTAVCGQFAAFQLTPQAAADAYRQLFNSKGGSSCGAPTAVDSMTECHPVSNNTAVNCSTSATPNRYYASMSKTANTSCPAGWYVTASGCQQTPPQTEQQYRPITTDQAQQKFEGAIKNNANKEIVWDAVRDYWDKGGQLEIDSPLSVVGPAQSPASTTTTSTTQQTANGSQTLTTTNTTVINYNYSGDTITVNQNTTSVTRNQAGDVVSSSTTTTTPQGVDEPPTDTPLPPVPDLYVRKYPNGMEGIYDEYKDQLKSAALVQLAKKLMPNVGDSGTCPSWPLNLDLAEWAAYGTHDVAPPCWIWDVARAILILSALLLARALIFGG